MQKLLHTFYIDKGIGKLKHIDVAYLWIQDEIRCKRLPVQRVKSEGNVADLGTKPLSKAVIPVSHRGTSIWPNEVSSATRGDVLGLRFDLYVRDGCQSRQHAERSS